MPAARGVSDGTRSASASCTRTATAWGVFDWIHIGIRRSEPWREAMNYATQPASGYGMAFRASSWPMLLSAHRKLTRAPF
jgi:hypothetical protein